MTFNRGPFSFVSSSARNLYSRRWTLVRRCHRAWLLAAHSQDSMIRNCKIVDGVQRTVCVDRWEPVSRGFITRGRDTMYLVLNFVISHSEGFGNRITVVELDIVLTPAGEGSSSDDATVLKPIQRRPYPGSRSYAWQHVVRFFCLQTVGGRPACRRTQGQSFTHHDICACRTSEDWTAIVCLEPSRTSSSLGPPELAKQPFANL